MTKVRLTPGQVLMEVDEPVDHVFFLESGLVCLLGEDNAAGTPSQVGMIGWEGCVGLLEICSGGRAALAGAVAQIGGTAMRMPAHDFRTLLETEAAIREVALRSNQALVKQLLLVSASNARETLLQRCIRWLVMAHSRLEGSDDILVTHDGLATLLGVRRSGVTVATAGLQAKGLIRTGRGRISIIDADGLRALTHVSPVGLPLPLPNRSAATF